MMLKTPDHVAQKWYSDVKATIDIRPDSVAMVAVQAQTSENFADESDSDECANVDSDTRCGWDPSRMLSGELRPTVVGDKLKNKRGRVDVDVSR